jgi:hypothetical protein
MCERGVKLKTQKFGNGYSEFVCLFCNWETEICNRKEGSQLRSEICNRRVPTQGSIGSVSTKAKA